MRFKKILIAAMAVVMMLGTTSCAVRDEAVNVEYNITKQADNFNVVRKITVINCIQGDVLFEMSGKMSITADTADNQLEVLVEDEGCYKKHFIGLSDNVTYVIEDITGADVDKYHYTLTYNPNMWTSYRVESID